MRQFEVDSHKSSSSLMRMNIGLWQSRCGKQGSGFGLELYHTSPHLYLIFCVFLPSPGSLLPPHPTHFLAPISTADVILCASLFASSAPAQPKLICILYIAMLKTCLQLLVKGFEFCPVLYVGQHINMLMCMCICILSLSVLQK